MRPQRTSCRMVSIAAAAALVLTASACSSGGGASGKTAVASGPVKIGLLLELTGELGSFGKPWEESMELARDEINASGALPGGAKIETIVEDGKTDAQVAVEAAHKMIDALKVSAILGPSSGPMVALAPLVKRSQVILISPAAGTVALNKLGGDFVFRTVASDDSDGKAMAKFLPEKKATNIGLLVQNEESTLSPAEVFRRTFESGGGKIASSVTYNPKQSSYRSELAQVLAAKPQWLVCACGQQSGVTIIRQAAAAGYKGQWLVTADIITPEAIKNVGADIMEGVYGEVASSDDSLEPYKRLATAYKQRFGADLYPFNANAYDAMILVGLAMVAAGGTSGADINGKIREVAGPPGKRVTTFADGVAALKAGEDIDYDGASGPVNLDATGSATSPYSIQQVTHGEWKQVQFYPADQFTG